MSQDDHPSRGGIYGSSPPNLSWICKSFKTFPRGSTLSIQTRSELEYKIQYDNRDKLWTVSTYSKGHRDHPLVTESKKKINDVIKSVEGLASVDMTCGRY